MTTPLPRAKADRPETLSQVKSWDRNKLHYSLAGFCDTCAAQAAWGHQIGFSRVRRPCRVCSSRELPDLHAGEARPLRWLAGLLHHDG